MTLPAQRQKVVVSEARPAGDSNPGGLGNQWMEYRPLNGWRLADCVGLFGEVDGEQDELTKRGGYDIL